MKKTFTILSTLACCLLLVSGLMVNNVYGQSPVTASPAAVEISGGPDITNPDYAFNSDNTYAEFTTSAGWATYHTFNLATSGTILGIEVLLEGYAVTGTYTVNLSKNTGTNLSPTSLSADLPSAEGNVVVGSPTELWGLSWTAAEVDAAGFSVRITSDALGNQAFLDHIQVRVYYSVPPNIVLVDPIPIVYTDAGYCYATVDFDDYIVEVTGYPTPTLTYHDASPPFRPGNQYLNPTSTVLNSNATYGIYAYATNGYGSQVKSFNLTVEDNENPTLTLPTVADYYDCDTGDLVDETGFALATIGASVTLTELEAQGGDAGDNCTGFTISYQDEVYEDTETCVITVTRTWTVTDASTNEVSDSQVITISPPAVVLTPPAEENIAQCTDQTAVDAAFDTWFSGFSSSGGCGLLVTTEPASPEAPSFCGGSITVTWTGTSDCEDDVVVASTFTVEPDLAPEFFAREDPSDDRIAWLTPDIEVSRPAGSCPATVDWVTPFVQDDCLPELATPTRTITPAPVSTVTRNPYKTSASFNPGTYTVTYTYTDRCSNTISRSFNITVNDPFDPTFTGLTPDYVIDTDAGECTATVTNWAQPTPSHSCGVTMKTLLILADGTVIDNYGSNTYSYFQVGVNSVNFVATSDISGNVATRTFTVTVTDNEFPVVYCTFGGTVVDNSITVSNVAEECFATLDFTVSPTDNCEIGTITYTIVFADTFTQVYQLVATGATLTATFDYQYPVGSWYVTIGVEDVNGNVTSCGFDVTVEDDEDPVVALTPITRSLDGYGNYVLTQADVDAIIDASDNCVVVSPTTASIDPNTFDCGNLGVNVVTVTVVDVNDNEVVMTTAVTILDDEDPVVECVGPITEDTATGVCTWTYSDTNPLWGITIDSDNCAVVTRTYSIAGVSVLTGDDDNIIGQVFNVGVTTVTWTVYDQSGNEASCSFTVTVEDNQHPIFTSFPVPANPYYTDPDVCTVSQTFTAEAEDNCGVEHIKYYIDYGTGSQAEITFPYDFPVGSTEVTVVATDVNDNTTVQAFTVEVEDIQPPVFVGCPEGGHIDFYVVDNFPSDNCNPVVFWDPISAYDNCPDPNTPVSVSAVFSSTGSTYFTGGGPTFYHQKQLSIGVTTVTYTASDNQPTPNTSQCVFTIAVHSFYPPLAVAANRDVYLDEDGFADIQTTDLNITGSRVGCLDGVESIHDYMSLSQTTFDCNDVGELGVEVILTVTDKTGRIASTTFTVFVHDNEPPVLAAKDIIVELDANGEATITAMDVYDEPNSDDNCGIDTNTLTLDKYDFDCDDVGQVIVVTLNGEDVNGNAGLPVTATITVVDNVPPTLVVQDATVELDENGDGVLNPAQVVLSATDVCGILTVTLSRTDFTCVDVGVHTIDVTAEDINNNTTTLTAQITVVDLIPPSITCISGTITRTTTGPAVGEDVGICGYIVDGDEFDPVVDDNCGVDTVTNTFNGLATLAGAELPTGPTDITWYVTDVNGNTNSCTITIEVTDDEPPVFVEGTFPESKTRTLGSGACSILVSWDIPDTDDNCDVASLHFVWETNNSTVGDIYPEADGPGKMRATFHAGITTITYTITDIHDNITYRSFTVTVIDVNDPFAIAIATPLVIELNELGLASIMPEQIDNGSYDDCGDVLLGLDTDTFTCADIGANTVILIVTDLSGRTAYASADVIVVDLLAPEIACVSTSTLTVGTDTGTCTYTVAGTEFDPSLVEDNCWVETQTYTLTGDTDSEGPVVAKTLQGEVFNKGTTTVVWTAIDSSGNETSCSFDVVVEDDEYPTIACVSVQQVETDPGDCTYTVKVDEFDPDSYGDNCPDYVVSYELTGDTQSGGRIYTNTLAGVVFEKGITTVTWYITDAANNESNCAFTVLVEDKELPSIACVTDTFRYNTGPEDPALVGLCGYVVEGDEFDPVVDDNCEVATVTNTYTGTSYLDGAIFPVGSTEVIWYVTDTSGNVNSCTMTIEVEDNEDPVFVSFPDALYELTTTTTLQGDCFAELTWYVPVADDNCGIVTETLTRWWTSTNTQVVTINFNEISGIPAQTQAIFPVGYTTVYYSIEDIYGNVHTRSFTVHVNDTKAPVITREPDNYAIEGCTVADITSPVFSEDLVLSSYAVFSDEPNNGEAYDECYIIAEVWYQDVVIEAACPIVVDRTWYLKDYSGNTVSHTQTITVDETEPPTLIAGESLPGGYQDNVCLSAMPPAPAAVDIAALYEDNCTVTPTASLTYTDEGTDNSDCSWIVTYTYTVVDDCLNETIAHVVYYGGDTESPSLITPTLTCNEEFGESDVNECLAVAEQFDAEALEAGIAALYEDNCASEVSATLTNTEAGAENSDCSWVFTYTFTISDGCPANDITCDVVRSGGDSEPPALINPAITTASLNNTDPINECLSVAVVFDPTSFESAVAGLYDDNCTATPTATWTATEAGAGNTDCAWIFTYTFVVSDDCGNTVTPTVVRSGGDTEGPVVQNAKGFKTHYTCLLAVPDAPEVGVPAANETSLYWTDNCSDVVEIILVRSLSRQLDCPQTYILTRTWSVTDECDNVTIFDQVITVLDDIPPALVDDEKDTETMLAQTDIDECKAWIDGFDATSLEADVAALYEDNCGTHTATLVANATVITGDDCEWMAVFTYEIADECFNSVTATVTYSGGDKTAPEGDMPDAIVDEDACADDALAAYPFDAAYAVENYSDNCAATVTVTLENTDFTGDNCGWTITYTFSVWDDCDNELADQYYTVSGSNLTPPSLVGTPYVGLDDVNACYDGAITAAAFDAAMAVEGYAAFCSSGTVTATLTDTDLTGDDCAWTITYTFTITDNCGLELTGQTYTNSGGDMEDPQIIGCNFDVEVVTVTSGCDFVADDRWNVTATDNCSTPALTYELTGVTVGTGSNTLAGVTFAVGTTTVTWTATDGCRRTDVCSFTVVVSIGAPQFMLPLVADQVEDVDDSSACTYTHDDDTWDPQVDDPCERITLSYELSGATEGTGTTLNGQTFNVGVTTVLWTATDGTLTSTHTYDVTVRPTALSGYITYYKYDAADLPLGGFTVRLMNGGSEVASTTTSAAGYYEFTNQTDLLLTDRIEVFTTIPHGGLSSGDALAVSLRVATTPPVYWGPAAPVDYVKFLDHVGDVHTPLGTLNTTDAFVLFQRHVGTRDNFVAGDWAFYATNDETIFTNSSASAAYRMYDMGYCTMDISVRTYGDVRGTYSPVAAKSFIPVQSDNVMNVIEGETFELPVTIDHAIAFNAVSFYLDYASDKLEVLEVQSDIPGMTTMIENGMIRVEWYDLAPQSLAAGDAFITLVARTTGEVTPGDLLFNLGTATEFVDAAAQTIPDVEVSVSSLNTIDAITGITDPDQLSVSLDAYPNPFRDELNLRYAIPEAGMVRISVVNMLGSEVARLVNHQHEAGVFTHSFTPNDGSMEHGVYFVRFEVVGESIQTSRVVRIIYNK